MPTYAYKCNNENCNAQYDVFQSFKDDPLQQCTQCLQNTLQRLISGGLCAMDMTPKTLGHLADKNTDKFSADFKKHLRDKHTEYMPNKNVDKDYETYWPKKSMREIGDTKKYIYGNNQPKPNE